MISLICWGPKLSQGRHGRDAGRWSIPHSQMLRSPQDTHVDHLRSLLDQRSTRAGSFSAISEDSDTPSVYSRPFFSPKSSDNSQYHPSSTFDIESHLDHLDRPGNYTPSILDFDDLDDDRHSSFAPSEEIDIDDTSYEDEDNNFADRLSYLGPKMRVHSRAPWELEDDTHEEDAETEEVHRSFQSVFPFRGNGAKSVASSSSSPRPSYTTSRPSGESSRSQVPPKRSFDTINSQLSYQPGTFQSVSSFCHPFIHYPDAFLSCSTLVQESVSSLGQFTPPAQKNTRSNFPLGRLRPESSNVDLSPSSNPSPGRGPLSARFPPMQDNDLTVRRNSVKIEEGVHPYANPELVVYPTFREGNIALSESCTTDSGDITVNSASSKHCVSSIQPKIISSPLPHIGSPRLIEAPLAENRLERTVSPRSNNLSSWTDSNATPAFSLISLEEARAQRMRSATVNPTSRMSVGMSNPSSMFPPMETEATPGADSSPVGGSITRTRARSISAGANRARSVLQTFVSQTKPERRDSEPTLIAHNVSAGHPGKTLKHKKSGFMRLFNAGKVPERNEQKIPPPVPSLPDSHSNNRVQSISQRAKTSVHRIPVPRLSPSLFESSREQSHDTITSDTWKQSTRRPPGLSITINTQQQPVAGIVSASVVDGHGSQTQPPWTVDQPLQSAPADVSVFPPLKLRPVSLFSAHFGDHIVDTESPSLEMDFATPRSSSPALTPVSATQASYEQQVKYSLVDNQASVVRSLQEELAAARKAWQLRIWELEGQVRDLKATVEELKGSDNRNYCQSCGRTTVAAAPPRSESVVNRPRARTGTSSRFTNALP